MQTPRKQHYNFAYYLMPLLALRNSKELFDRLNRNDRVRYLKNLWNGFGKKLNENISDFGFDCINCRIGKKCTLYIVQLPKPLIQPEAFYIGIAYFVEIGLLKNQISKVRYFTLELGKEVLDEREKYYVGEWLVGESTNRFDHKNYGSIIKKDVDTFEIAVKNVLFGNLNPYIWMDNISENDPKNVYSEDSNNFSTPCYGEKDLELLWNKWTHFQVDDFAQELCNKAIQPFGLLLWQYSQLCLSAGIYPKDMAGKLDEWIGTALGHLGRGSFMIGLEYPDIDLDSPNIKSQVPYKLLEVASTASKKLFTLLLSQLVENGIKTKSECFKIAENGGELILKGMVECYAVGMKYSPKKK